MEQSGFYEFTDLYDDACSGASSIGSVPVTVNPLPTATVNLDDPKTIYINPGGTATFEIVFTGNAPYTFNYSIDETNLTAVTTSDNPYNLVLSDEGTYEIISISDLYCINDSWQDHFDIIYDGFFRKENAIAGRACHGQPAIGARRD